MRLEMRLEDELIRMEVIYLGMMMSVIVSVELSAVSRVPPETNHETKQNNKKTGKQESRKTLNYRRVKRLSSIVFLSGGKGTIKSSLQEHMR